MKLKVLASAACIAMLFTQTSSALADKYSPRINGVIDTVNEVGDRACAGTQSAVSRLFYYSEGKDRALAGQAYLNHAWMISPSQPCSKAGYKHNRKKWQSYLERAAELGWPPALAYYGGVLMDGKSGIKPNGRRALTFLLQAEAAGSSVAAARLAKGFYEGTLSSGRDLKKAQKYLEIAYSRNPSKTSRKILDKYKPLIAKATADKNEPAGKTAEPGTGKNHPRYKQLATALSATLRNEAEAILGYRVTEIQTNPDGSGKHVSGPSIARWIKRSSRKSSMTRVQYFDVRKIGYVGIGKVCSAKMQENYGCGYKGKELYRVSVSCDTGVGECVTSKIRRSKAPQREENSTQGSMWLYYCGLEDAEKLTSLIQEFGQLYAKEIRGSAPKIGCS